MSNRVSLSLLLASIVPHLLASSPLGADDAPVDYNRQVRPILAANCYACHGPDAEHREAKLRLDVAEDALADRDGGAAIVAGSPQSSRLVQRITASDPDDVMPPRETGKSLTAEEVLILQRWIEQGAKFGKHWAFVPPKRSAPPPAPSNTAKNPIDHFILEGLRQKDLEPSALADRTTLTRRLHFDLIGLPPEPDDETLAADDSEEAYTALVDRLLESPHHGERMALFWLDLVRFADTRGYHSDNPRNVSPYRDYVIRSFNENKRFDVFTIEQLAGDLLPDADIWQRVASCYNKLNQTTEEGGAQPKEYEAKNASDRVRNVSVVWLGATLGCAECHDHKFDPYGARDFYSLAAFFADIRENPISDRDAGVPVPSLEDEAALRELDERIATARAELENPPEPLARELTEAQQRWEASQSKRRPPTLSAWHAVGPFAAGDAGKAFSRAFGPEKQYLENPAVDLEASFDEGKFRWREEGAWTDGKVHTLSGANAATYLFRRIESPDDSTLGVSLGSDDGIQVWLNGTSLLSKNVARGVAPDQEKVTLPLRTGTNYLLMKINNGGGGYGFYFKPLDDGVPAAVREVLAIPAAERTADQSLRLASFYRSISPLLEEQRKTLGQAEQSKAEREKSFPRCLVSVAAEPRKVRVLPRGNWLDESGEVVAPAIPQFFGTLDVGDRRATRLDLARWFVSEENPLTARVFVNRLWKLFFGRGLSSRLDDLGAMGEAPTHPELLDWLAIEFVESGWNVRHMIRLMLHSRTYRQSSVETQTLRRKDPYNRLLARQSRWRLDAELVRDNALATSDLLSRRVGGPSVKPYQPGGYWTHLNFPKRRWVADTGDNAYRRGLYTWWQRSFLHPSLMAFDAPNREECTAERPRSNIPQQALVLLNDPTYVEAARVLASHALTAGESTAQRIRWAFRRATSRPATDNEVEVLQRLYRAHHEDYAANPQAADELLAVGGSPAPSDVDRVELAATTSVMRAILNLHEVVTRN